MSKNLYSLYEEHRIPGKPADFTFLGIFDKKQIADICDTSENNVFHSAQRGTLLSRKYRVVFHSKVSAIKNKKSDEPKVKKKKLTKSEQEFLYLEKMLRENGNTITTLNPKNQLKKLEEVGLKCKVTYFPAHVMTYVNSLDGAINKKRFQKEDWLLEVIK